MQLVAYIADPIPAGVSDARRYKYPYVAAEMVCCEVVRVLEAIAGSPSALPRLFGMLDQPPESLDHRHSGYLEKVRQAFVCLSSHIVPATPSLVVLLK